MLCEHETELVGGRMALVSSGSGGGGGGGGGGDRSKHKNTCLPCLSQRHVIRIEIASLGIT